MQVESLRRGRRVLSAAVSLAAIALVMAKVDGGGAANALGSSASFAFVIALVLLVVVWRKEHVASEAAFATRAEQQLAVMKRELELAEQRRAEGPEPNVRLTSTKATDAQRRPSR